MLGLRCHGLKTLSLSHVYMCMCIPLQPFTDIHLCKSVYASCSDPVAPARGLTLEASPGGSHNPAFHVCRTL